MNEMSPLEKVQMYQVLISHHIDGLKGIAAYCPSLTNRGTLYTHVYLNAGMVRANSEQVQNIAMANLNDPSLMVGSIVCDVFEERFGTQLFEYAKYLNQEEYTKSVDMALSWKMLYSLLLKEQEDILKEYEQSPPKNVDLDELHSRLGRWLRMLP